MARLPHLHPFSIILLLSLIFLVFGIDNSTINNDRVNGTFAIVTVFTVHEPWISGDVAKLGLIYGMKAQSTYALMHGYSYQPAFTAPPKQELNWNRVRMTLQKFQHKKYPEQLNCEYEWVVWMESDVWITNTSVQLEEIIAEGVRQMGGRIPDIITNKDASGNINTGMLFVRCSEMGRRIMKRCLELQVTHARHPLIDQWDSNGAIFYMHNFEPEYKNAMAVIPPKIFNAYAFPNPNGDGTIIACPDKKTCDDGYWSPGDFVVHFAGHKERMKPFLTAFPPTSWVGHTPLYLVPLERQL